MAFSQRSAKQYINACRHHVLTDICYGHRVQDTNGVVGLYTVYWEQLSDLDREAVIDGEMKKYAWAVGMYQPE